MKTVFTKAFSKDLRKLKNPELEKRIANTIRAIEEGNSLSDISAVKTIQGSDNHYRIRIGDYRMGIMEKDGVIVFMRFLHRKEIYRYFP